MTWMSRFLGLAVIALGACGSDGPSTSLAGMTACDSNSCGAGQLCQFNDSGAPDGGVGQTCLTVPQGCRVFDCHGTACPVCIAQACAYYPELYDQVEVTDRTLTCPGE